MNKPDNIIKVSAPLQTNKPDPFLEKIIKIICATADAQVVEMTEVVDGVLEKHRRKEILLAPRT